MKIGVVTEYYYPSLGGITEHVHHFCVELKRLGHHPVIITSNAGKVQVSDENIEIIRVGKSIPLYSNGSIARMTVGFNLGRKIDKIMRTEKFDVVHVHSPFIPILPGVGQHYANTATFGTFHTQFDSSFFLKLMQKTAKKYFDALKGRIAVSELCVESMRRYYDGTFRIIPNGIDVNKFYPACDKIEKFVDDKLNIFFLSRLEPRNGLEHLIDAFSIIRKKRSDCRLIIGGDGPLKSYYEKMVSEKIRNDVVFLGQINDKRPNYYATADIFCFPTTRASFGITILEAMAAGKPVVAFSMPAYEKIIKSGEEGVLCGEFGAGNLADAIENLLDSSEKRNKIGEAARKKAESFSWVNVTRQVLDYYAEVRS